MYRFVKRAASSIANAAAGRIWIFADSNGRLSTKDDAGGVAGYLRQSEVGTAATKDTGTALTEVPTGQDLQDGFATGFSNWAHTPGRVLGATNSDYMLLFEAGSNAIGLNGNLVSGSGTAGTCGYIRFAATQQPDGDISGFCMSVGRAGTAKLVTVDVGGTTWVAIRYSGASGAAGFSGPTFSGYYTTGFPWENAVTANLADASGETDVTFDDGPYFSGFPGAAIGDNGALRNTNQSLGEATDFPVEEGTWTPVIQGSVVAGSHSYVGSTFGEFKLYGEVLHGEFDVGLSTLDGAASGALRIAGIPFEAGNNAAPAVSISYVLDMGGAPAEFVGYAPRIVNDGAGGSYVDFRFQLSTGDTSNFTIDNLTNDTRLRGSFSMIVA